MASSPLPPNTDNGRAKPVSLTCIRLTLLLLILGLTATSLYFSYKFTTLTTELHSEHETIENLSQTIQTQQATIDRFSDSVTNADVLNQVNQLKLNFHTTQVDLLTRLKQTEDSIHQVLDSTISELNQTVAAAETEIHNEVNRVEANVDKYVRTTQDQFSMENSFMIYQLAGTFTLLASLISMWHMTAHLRKFRRPFVQRKVLAILWMSPIYGVTSWLSLVFPQFEGYLAIIKDFYEAYIIYQFLGFLISVLGKGDRDSVVDMLSHHTDHLDPPIRMFGWCRGKYQYGSPRQLADAILLQCQFFCMQFVFLKPLTAIALFACNKLGYYGNFGATTSGDYRSPQFWILMVQNLSVFTAFSGLLKFYHAVQDDLAWCRPFPKFLCIKGIVFMTFWQGLVISILASTVMSNDGENSSSTGGGGGGADIWGKQAQNFLICLEMLLFSIAHFYCFPTEEWQEGYKVQKVKSRYGDNFALGDFMADFKLIMKGDKKNKKVKEEPHSGSSKTTGDTDEEEGHSSEGEGTHGLKRSTDNDENFDDDDDDNLDENDESFDEDDVSNNIRKSLAAPNAEVREAANRVLDQLNQASTRSARTESEREREQDQQSSGYGAMNNDIDEDIHNGPSDYFASMQSSVPNDTEESPGETTSLLNRGNDDDNDEESHSELLRPSIFTTVDGMGNEADFEYKPPTPTK